MSVVASWRKPEINEALATLYLRLNGYFTTGLIIHSARWGENRTEADCLAIRHPNHSQPDREVPSSPFLQIEPGVVDILVVEVKSLPADLRFNPRMQDDEAIRAMLRWVGVLDEATIDKVAPRFRDLLRDDADPSARRLGVDHENVRVRALLCCPQLSEADAGERWCLAASEILSFADECFNPPVRRQECSTRYNFRQWGSAFAPIVQFLKGSQNGPRKIEELYRHFGVT